MIRRTVGVRVGIGIAKRSATGSMAMYRPDGVRIAHDPYAPGMAQKYGAPGKTDKEGFDPYRDTVGPGIYGGRVKRDATASILIGTQYQGHNPRPGPVYAGGGYTPVNDALRDVHALKALLDKYPDLVNDVSTGGALPLHMCGMGGSRADAVELLCERGADMEAVDTYGYTPLQRMASNNLVDAARVLVRRGVNIDSTGACGDTPLQVALRSDAKAVVGLLRQRYDTTTKSDSDPGHYAVTSITVMGAGQDQVNGKYSVRPGTVIPKRFESVCQREGWDPVRMWAELSGAHGAAATSVEWYEHDNHSYIYLNTRDGHWWMDAPDGLGVYKAPAVATPSPPTARTPSTARAPPVPGHAAHGHGGWFVIDDTKKHLFPPPTLAVTHVKLC